MHDPTIARFLPGLEVESHVTSGGVAWIKYGTGPLFLLFHGGAGSWNHWVDNIPALARHFTVIGIDGPGFGASADTDRDQEVQSYLDLVRSAVDEITAGADEVRVGGFSFGGLVASAVTAHLGDRAAGLTLVGSAGFRRPERRRLSLKSLRALKEELGRELTEADIRGQHAANLGQLMIWVPEKIDDRAIDLQAANVDRTRFDSRPYSWSNLTPEYLRQTDCPFQIIYGDHDTSVGSDLEYRIQTALAARPDGEAEILPNCGHWSMYEAADGVNGLMIDFHAGA